MPVAMRSRNKGVRVAIEIVNEKAIIDYSRYLIMKRKKLRLWDMDKNR